MTKLYSLLFLIYILNLLAELETSQDSTTPPAPCYDPPPKVSNSRIFYNGSSHGDQAQYKCDVGYRLRGEEYFMCLYGQWEGTKPSCEPDYCPYPGTIDDGIILLVGVIGKYEYRPYVKRIGHNEKIEYQCNKGFQLSGPPGATCVDGEWSPHMNSSCVQTSYPDIDYTAKGRRMHDSANCTYQPDIPHAECVLNNQSSHITCTCNHGYLMEGSGVLTCQNGVWINNGTSCTPAYCEYPGPLDYGEILVVYAETKQKYEYTPYFHNYIQKPEENETIQYLCDNGYTSDRSTTDAKCVNRTWIPNRLPVCLEFKPVKKPNKALSDNTSLATLTVDYSHQIIPIVSIAYIFTVLCLL